MHLPLAHHAGAEPAARAAVAADAQGKFWEMHDLLYLESEARSDADFERFAKSLKLDVDKFKAAMTDPATAKVVADQRKVCNDNGATGTPTFFINGRRVEGSLPYDTFKAVVDSALSGGI
jgi:protein-disulfide isomerase